MTSFRDMEIGSRTHTDQLEEINACCGLFYYDFDLFEIDGLWYWAITDDETGEPVHLGLDNGYPSEMKAVHAAWLHIWPGRECRGK